MPWNGGSGGSGSGGTETDPTIIKPIGALQDAFGNLRVAQPIQLLSSVFDFSRGGGVQLEALRWDTELTGGATKTTNTTRASRSLTVGVADGDKVVTQTRGGCSRGG